MDLCEFQGNVYGKYKGRLFVLERDWGSFRPFQFVGWNSSEFQIVDTPYCSDIFDLNYGYGTKDMKKVCDALLRQTELEDRQVLTDPVAFWRWCGHLDKSEWWRDRPVVFASKCVPRGPAEWKAYLRFMRSPPKTLKRSLVVRRITKRLLPR